MDFARFFAGRGYDAGVAVVEADDGTTDYRAMLTATARVADLIAATGIESPHVAMSVQSTPLFLAALLGIARAGCVPVVLNPMASPESSERLARRAGARLILSDVARVGLVPTVMITSEVFDGTQSLADSAAPAARLPGVVMFTSGTTGDPKQVWLPESTLSRTLARHQSIDDYEDDFGSLARTQTVSVVKPLFHMSGMWNSLRAVACGSRIALLRKFDPTTFAAMVERFAIRQASLNTAMLVMLLDCPTSIDSRLQSLASVRMGAMALDPEVRAEFRRRFGCVVLDSYGQTETCGEVAGWTRSLLDELGAEPEHMTAVGRPNPGVPVVICSPDTSAAAEHGEICLDLGGYDQRVDGVRLEDRTPDGLHHTGDLGYLDSAGLLHITGRLGRLLNCGGFTISPEEIERALVLDPAVKDAVVVGLPDRRLGQVPVAVVTLTGFPVDELANVAARARVDLGGVKSPRQIIAVDRVPLSTMGKVDYAAVRELFTEPTSSAVTELGRWSRA